MSSLTIITAQVFHKSSLIPIKHRVLIMVQQPWQTPLDYLQNLQLNKVHRLDTFILKNEIIRFILSHLLMFNKQNTWCFSSAWNITRMSSIIRSSVLKSDVSKINGSRFSVLVIRKPLQPVLDSRMRTALAVGLFIRQNRHTCCSARVHHQFSLHSS